MDLPALRARYLQAQLAGNRREALRLLLEEGLERGAGAAELQLLVVAEAQREIGQLWQRLSRHAEAVISKHHPSPAGRGKG